MKNINDYKGTKTAIHCKTQEEWDKIVKLLVYTFRDGTWSNYESVSCIKCDANEYCDLDYYVADGYTIIPASDFMQTTRTIEQIETELEVLRNELELLKSEAQTPKKKIEFVKFLRSNTMSIDDEPLCKPSRYKHVELVFRYDHYDIMKAWSRDDKKDTTIYLGNFNDGIK